MSRRDRRVTDRERMLIVSQMETLIAEKKWSLEQAAKMIGITGAYLGLILKKKNNPSKEILCKMSFIVVTRSPEIIKQEKDNVILNEILKEIKSRKEITLR